MAVQFVDLFLIGIPDSLKEELKQGLVLLKDSTIDTSFKGASDAIAREASNNSRGGLLITTPEIINSDFHYVYNLFKMLYIEQNRGIVYIIMKHAESKYNLKEVGLYVDKAQQFYFNEKPQDEAANKLNWLSSTGKHILDLYYRILYVPASKHELESK